MQRFKASAAMILIFFVVYFLQSNLFTWFTFGGIMPNIYVIYILFIGLFLRKKMGLTFGILLGLFLDITTKQSIGISFIMYGLIGLLTEILGKDFSKDSKLTIILIVAVATVVFELVMYLFNVAVTETMLELGAFIKILIVEVIYNAIITIIIYSPMKKIGYHFEDSFSDKKVLTRFF